MNRVVVCEICQREIQVRSGMAYETISNHVKRDHKVQEVAA